MLTSISRTSSGTFRGLSQSALADEWLNITGALDVCKASFIVGTFTWEMSTIIPKRFISSTTACGLGNYMNWLSLYECKTIFPGWGELADIECLISHNKYKELNLKWIIFPTPQKITAWLLNFLNLIIAMTRGLARNPQKGVLILDK